MRASNDFSSYVAEIEAECEKLSRTASKGTLASDASSHKARHLLSVASADGLRTVVRSNLQEVVTYLSCLRQQPPTAVSEIRELVIAVNSKLTRNISQFPGALRDFDSDVYSYVQAKAVPGYLDKFSHFFSEALDKNDFSVARSASTAAKVHWDINIHGHFFADGCGRTATILGAWAYWINEGSVPQLPGLREYLELANSAREDRFVKGLAAYIINHAE